MAIGIAQQTITSDAGGSSWIMYGATTQRYGFDVTLNGGTIKKIEFKQVTITNTSYYIKLTGWGSSWHTFRTSDTSENKDYEWSFAPGEEVWTSGTLSINYSVKFDYIKVTYY